MKEEQRIFSSHAQISEQCDTWRVIVMTLNWRPNDLKRVIYLAHSNCDKRSRDIHGPNDCNVEDTQVCLHNWRKWADAIDKKT